MAKSEKFTGHLKTIIIGVITTVLGALLIYWLDIRSDKKAESKKRIEATQKAWKAYRDNKKALIAGFQTQFTDTNLIEMKDKAAHEFSTSISLMDNIAKSYPNADERMLALIEINKKQLIEMAPIYDDFYNSLLLYSDKNPTEQDFINYISQMNRSLETKTNSLLNRDTIRTKQYVGDLKEEYDLKY